MTRSNLSSEARLFVRHSDGMSLVVPEQTKTEPKLRLSFSVGIPDSIPSGDRFEEIKKMLSADEEANLNDFVPQHYLGTYGVAVLANRLQADRAHAYLAQIWPGRSTGAEVGRQTISFIDVEQLVHSDARVDQLDRRLAARALKTIRQIQPRNKYSLRFSKTGL